MQSYEDTLTQCDEEDRIDEKEYQLPKVLFETSFAPSVGIPLKKYEKINFFLDRLLIINKSNEF